VTSELRIIDMHTHLWSDASGNAPNPTDLPTLTQMIDRFDLEAIVLIPLFGGLCPTRDNVTAGNNAAADAARSDKRFRPLVTVYPRHGESFCLDQIHQHMASGLFHGLKIWVSPADEPVVDPLIGAMITYNKPTLIHAMHKSVGQLPLESDPTHIARLARRHPKAKIILPHVGGNFYYTCDVIADLPNLHTDPSGTYCETGMVEHAVKLLGPDRVMFGSDAPGADFANNLAKVLAADLPAETIEKVLSTNARKLFHWT
jgi:predicted TIM-barrel fold metal-dependent hydrolase